jgi:VanZ family protein
LLAISPLIPDGNKIIPRITPQVQNILHVPVFAMLSIMLFLIFCDYQMDRLKSIILVILISQAVSIFTESIQLFIPDRCPSFKDIRSNFIGTSIGVFFIFGMNIIKTAKSRSFFL